MRSELTRPLALIAAIVSLSLYACGGSAPQSSSTPSTGAAAPASTPAAHGPRLYVSDETGGNVVVIDPASASVIERIPVGKRPRAIRLSRDGKSLFIALSGSPIAGPGVDESALPPADRTADGIGELDLTTHKMVRKYPSGQDPEVFDISPDGKTLYVSNEDAAQMSVLDLGSGTIRTRVPVGEEPEGVTVSPNGREVYVSCEGTSEVVVIDTASDKVLAHIKTGPRPRSIVFTADGATAFVTNENAAAVTVIDAAAHKAIGSIKIPKPEGAQTAARPMGTALSPDGKQVFVSLGRASAVAVIDAAAHTLLRTIDNVGARPWGIAVSADGQTLYTANGPGGEVSIVDIAAGKVEKKVAAGGSPWGVVLSR